MRFKNENSIFRIVEIDMHDNLVLTYLLYLNKTSMAQQCQVKNIFALPYE